MNLPIVYQPNTVSDDSTMRFMLLAADIWVKTKPKKLTLADIDESRYFCWDDDLMRRIDDIAEAGDEMIRSMGGTVPWRPRPHRPSNSSHTK